MNKDEQWLLDEKYKGVASPAYEADKTRLACGEPIAYVLGTQPFLGLTIHLDSKPLIPRPETEWWTDQLLKSLGAAREAGNEPARCSQIKFLDLCAGSGAIGCAALARLPDAQVYFGEINPAHKDTIVKNIRENHLDESRAHIGIGDLFEPFTDTVFDVIAINPPYIPSERKLDRSVSDFEPHEALFSGSDGLAHMRRIAHELKKHLRGDGIAWIECDEAHVREAQELFIAKGLPADIRTDQYGVPRILTVRIPA